jgi:hypothetical protein
MPPEDPLGEASREEVVKPKEHSFDELTKGLAKGTLSRSRALKLACAAIFGGALSVLVLPVREAEARRHRRHCPPPPPPCGPATCSGCCDQSGACLPGTTNANCGSGGAPCQTCLPAGCPGGDVSCFEEFGVRACL